MKKYWIIENGHPVGPFTQSELKVRRDFTADLPVWCAELPDWTTVGRLPELACLLPDDDISESEAGVVEEPAESSAAPFAEPAASAPVEQPAAAQWIITAPPEEIDGVRRPKSFIGWNVAMILCCCMPVAVAGLIFGSQVARHWMRGDVAKAQKSSEYAEWCVILSFVLGLVIWPFQLIFSFI